MDVDTSRLIEEIEKWDYPTLDQIQDLCARAAVHLRQQMAAIEALMKQQVNSEVVNVIVQNRMVAALVGAQELLNFGYMGLQFLDPVAVQQFGRIMGGIDTLIGILAPEFAKARESKVL